MITDPKEVMIIGITGRTPRRVVILTNNDLRAKICHLTKETFSSTYIIT